jgi:hypothetical protein
MYRMALPIRLAELDQVSHFQTWQTEVIELCFKHANAINELLGLATASGVKLTDWPGFVSYCVFTAGTVHLHGVHYDGQVADVWSLSVDYLAQDIQYLNELSSIWSGVQHQKDTLQVLYSAHAELLNASGRSTQRRLPIFEMEDFFNRYPNIQVDDSYVAMGESMADRRSWISDPLVERSQNQSTHLSTTRLSSERANSDQLPETLTPESIELGDYHVDAGQAHDTHASPPELFFEPSESVLGYPSMASPDVSTPQSTDFHLWSLQSDNTKGGSPEFSLDFWPSNVGQTYGLPSSDFDWGVLKSEGHTYISPAVINQPFS